MELFGLWALVAMYSAGPRRTFKFLGWAACIALGLHLVL